MVPLPEADLPFIDAQSRPKRALGEARQDTSGVELAAGDEVRAISGHGNLICSVTLHMPTLTSFALSTNANSNRSRMVGSAALSYQIAAHQRVTAGMHVRENAYVTRPTRTAQMTYEMAF